MAIKSIKIANFKSFKDLELNLTDFNVLIGANASGKSSFVQAFDFLRNIPKNGLTNAISMQGGVEYLRNIKIGRNKPLRFEIVVEPLRLARKERELANKTICRELVESRYSFSLEFSEDQDNYEVVEDELSLQFKYFEDRDNSSKKEIGAETLTLFNEEGQLDLKIAKRYAEDLEAEILQELSDFSLDRENIIPPFFQEISLVNKQLILESSYTSLIDPLLQELLGGISIYNINPSLSKKATAISGRADLEEDGSNLALVLRKIIEDQEKERKLSNLIKDILPFVKKMSVEKFADRSLMLKLNEIYYSDEFIPASLLSDGTINITALIIALYFENKRIAIFEEPERNIHPHLISRLVEMFADASSQKQLLITTHNPEIVKYIDFANLFLVHRDEEGFSRINKPIEKEEVKLFLQNDMGIDELYIQNLLEV